MLVNGFVAKTCNGHRTSNLDAHHKKNECQVLTNDMVLGMAGQLDGQCKLHESLVKNTGGLREVGVYG